ncbi:hypothetical protein G4P69_07465 [Aetokthonos hydrillicola CCALA 1050]|jgi:uncharacterized protein (DUF433 family)|nr:hypothetical protein [Aetokthonos hydrillicola CCALA 1050]
MNTSDSEVKQTRQANFNITPEEEAKLNWLRQAIGALNIKETILRSIDLMVTLKRHIRPGSQLFLHTQEGQVRLLIPELESPQVDDWQYLVERPHPWRRQLYIKGRKLLASTIWQDIVVNQMSQEEAADNWDLPLAVIQEAILYCETHQELLSLEAQEERYRLEEQGVSLDPQTIN